MHVVYMILYLNVQDNNGKLVA